MKNLLAMIMLSMPLFFTPQAFAQSSGSDSAQTKQENQDMNSESGSDKANPGDKVDEASDADKSAVGDKETVSGMSVKNDIMGKTVENEDDDKVGDVRDVILDEDGEATHYVIGAGGFLGVGEHNVAISIDDIERGDDRFILRGYSKDELKELPSVEVSK